MLPTQIEARIAQSQALAERGAALAEAIHGLVMRGGAPARRVADALHGTGLGHPLHPILTDIPIGAWSLAALCDLVAAITGSPDAERAADTLIAAGAAAAVPTALAGAADYSTIPQQATATGALHGILNGSALGLYLLSLAARRGGQRGVGVGLALAAFGLVGAAGALGGDLVYRHKVGVNHSDQPEAEGDWEDVLAEIDLAEGAPQRVDVADAPVLLYREGERVWAIGAVCSHAGAPLDEGRPDGHCIQCPWHDSVFDMRSGAVVHGPATFPQPAYDARISRGRVQVRARSAG